MLSESLPPLRYSTTRLRPVADCARARSLRKSGAAKVTVNAATPPCTNCRRVIFICDLLQLIFRRSDDEVHEARHFVTKLCIVARPRSGRAQVGDELGRHSAVERRNLRQVE